MCRSGVRQGDAARAAARGTVLGKGVMGSYPYEDLYMLSAARQFVPVMRNTKLILLGGITNREHIETGLREGFGFVAMGRALLREPDLVNKMNANPAIRSRCTHNNKCMVTVFARTHCVLDPEQRYGAVRESLEAAAMPQLSDQAADQSRHLRTPGRARAQMSSWASS